MYDDAIYAEYAYIQYKKKEKRRRKERENLARTQALLSNADEGKLAHMHNTAQSAFRFRWEHEDVKMNHDEAKVTTVSSTGP